MRKLWAVLLGVKLLFILAHPAGATLPQAKGEVLAVQAGVIKVSFQRTPGVGDFTGTPEIKIDTSRLRPEEAHQLRQLLADARFFQLGSSRMPPPEVPDPLAGYAITVEQGGKKHSVWLVDADVTPAVQPLLDWLARQARARLAPG